MNRTSRIPLAGALACICAFSLAGPVQAEDAGHLELLAFSKDGRPVAGLEVRVGGKVATTGAGGMLRVELGSGVHPLELRRGDLLLAKGSVPVAWGGVSEVIATVDGDAASLAIEAPGWPRPEAEVPTDQSEVGAIAGVLFSEKGDAPIAGARILVRGQIVEAVSDEAGRYRLNLPAGKHTVSVIHSQFSTLTRGDVYVPAGGIARLDLRLTPAGVELETHRVSGYRLEGGLASMMDEKREQKSMTEIIGSEQISKSGDSDAAEALKRVTGLTVVGGKYVFVRGMGARYSSTLLDGSTLPSPEPERRVVPLSLFPTDVVESIAIRKTYSPELPGEFGGGTVEIRTKGIPEELFGRAEVNTSYREGTTGQKGLTYNGGGSDFLGYDDGTRAIPNALRLAADREPVTLEDPFTGEGYPLYVLEGLGERMPNVWSTRTKTIPMNVGVDLSLGNRHETAIGDVGYRVAVGYDNSYRRIDGEINRAYGSGANGSLVPIVDYSVDSLTNTVNGSAMVGLSWAPNPDHELFLNTLYLHKGRDRTEVYQGLLTNDDTTIRVTQLEWTEEDLFSTQLRGKHTVVGDARVSWRYAYSLAARYQPDSRRTRYDLDPATDRYLLSNRPEGNQRLYNELVDNNHDLGFDVEVPFQIRDEQELTVAVGAGYIQRDREVDTRRFKFIHRGPQSRDPDLLANRPEEVFTYQTIGADGFTFEEITRATDNYEATQTLAAAYVRVDVPLHKSFDASVGVRVEDSDQQVETYNLFSRSAEVERAELQETDFLPAVNLTWRFFKNMQLRGGYSRTLSRPDFRELSSAPFDQVIGAGVFIGNPDLDRTVIDNVDLRWEFYPSQGETLSLGVFFKELHDPIETVILGGANRTITLDNADRARNLGVELEFRKSLEFVAQPLEFFYFAGNLALIRSEVELKNAGIATESERPLQGQSEYVLNLSIGYDDPDAKLSIALLYNIYGERITGIGTFGVPDIYEQPRHQLDLVFRWRPFDHVTLRFKAQNLLDQKVVMEQGGEVVSRLRLGRTFSGGISLSF